MLNKTSSSSGGISFVGLLTTAFIVLKLVGVINWAWLWVLSPIWIVILLEIVFISVVAAVWFAVERFK